MKQILLLIFFAFAACTEALSGELRVRFGMELFVGTNYFIAIPTTMREALSESWTPVERPPTNHYPSLTMYCDDTRVVCVFFDPTDTEHVAGLQIALAEDEFTGAVFDYKTQGFSYWTTTTSNGTAKNFWTIQQYYVSEETLKKSKEERQATRSSGVLTENAVWVTGFNGELLKISADESDIQQTMFTEQACVILMGEHYYYNMSSTLECRSDTILPWFPLVYHGELIGTGFMTFGQKPEISGTRDWFERPGQDDVQMIVPRAPQCLYDLASSPGALTMHIYYYERPWFIQCLF